MNGSAGKNFTKSDRPKGKRPRCMTFLNVLDTSRQVRKPIYNGFGYKEQVITCLS
jgi:hypothetical protein